MNNVNDPASTRHSLESPAGSAAGTRQYSSLNGGPISLDSVLITSELFRRPSRAPDYEAENKALASLMQRMASTPRKILASLAEAALKLCRAQSAGLSLLEEENGQKVFRWQAAAGQWSCYEGGIMPRAISPCGTVLDRNAPLLFSHPERHFPFPPDIRLDIAEALLVPFEFADEPIGTIWVVAHDDSRYFDAEDLRVLSSLGRFASTAYQLLSSLDALKIQMAARDQAEAESQSLLAQQHRDREFLTRLIEHSPVAIAVLRGLDLEFTLVNPAYQAATGTNVSIVGRTLPDVFPEMVQLGAVERLRNLIRTGQEYKIQDLRFVRDNTVTWWDGEALPLANEAGEISSVLVLAWDITERKRAEEALLDRELRLRRILDALPAATYTTDPEGRLTYFNPAAVEMTGRTPELQTDNWGVSWKLYHPDGTPMPHSECPMAIALKEGRAIRDVEAILERPDGTRISFLPYPTPLRDAQGKIIGGVNMLVDITERKRADAASAFLAAIVNCSDDAIIGKDLNCVITSWNKGAERLFGYTAQEAIGRPVTMLIPPDRQHEEAEILSRVRRGEPVAHFETFRIRKNSSLVEISLTVSPIRDSKGRIIGASKIARDISDRKRGERELVEAQRELQLRAETLERNVAALKQAEDALRHSEQNFRQQAQLLDLSDDPIIVRDLEHRIHFWSRGAEKTYGWAPSEALGQVAQELLHTQFPLPLETIVTQTLQEGFWRGELVQQCRDQHLVVVDSRWTLQRDEKGGAVAILMINRDITERKREQETLRELTRDLQEAQTKLQQHANELERRVQ